VKPALHNPSQLNRGLFLETLNGNRKFAAERLHWLNKAKVFTAAADVEYQSADQEITRHLRGLIDQWIGSGITDDGSEKPYERNLNDSMDAYEIAQEFLNDEKPLHVLVNAGRGAGLYHLWSIHAWHPPGQTDDPIAAARHEAKKLFVVFLDSGDFVHCLFRCKRCGKYFERRNPHRSYKRGSYCGNCVHKATATESTKNARDAYRKRVLGFAAQAWLLWETTGKREDRSVWVARWVKERLRTDEPKIKRNWVTMNREEIAVRAMQTKKKGR